MPEMYRIRITFSKLDALRFVGHLDLAKTWERVVRRAGIPLIYSKGFNPQPKIQLASALPLGISSECELMDIWLSEPVERETLPEVLNAVSPTGLRALHADAIPLKSPALQTLIDSADYLMAVEQVTDEDVNIRIGTFLAAEQVLRERRGRVYDLRPLVRSIDHAHGGTFGARLAAGDRGNARPDELLSALGLEAFLAHCHRTALHLRLPDDQPGVDASLEGGIDEPDSSQSD